MKKTIKQIHENPPGYDEDETEFVTLNGIAFTGVVKSFHNGHISSITSYFKGHWRGYYLWYFTTGANIGAIQVLGYGEGEGIRIAWSETGEIEDIATYCAGRVLEKMTIVENRYVVETLMNQSQREKLFTNPVYGTQYCQRESIAVLYDQAMQRLHEGTLFEEDWLYTDENYYDGQPDLD